MKGILDFYRIQHGKKISALRLLFYPVLGLTISGTLQPALFSVDLAIVFLGILSASFFNDYYDWQMLGEDNGVATLRSKVLLPGIAPALVASIMLVLLPLWHPSVLSVGLLWTSFALSLAYCIPPLRLKEVYPLNIVIPPLGIYFLFLQALLLVSYPSLTQWLIAVILLLFTCYIEMLHLIDDSLQAHESPRLSTGSGMMGLRIVAGVGLTISFACSVFSLIFLPSVITWFLRCLTVYRINPHEVVRARKNIFHPVWRLEEFVWYAALGVWHALFL